MYREENKIDWGMTCCYIFPFDFKSALQEEKKGLKALFYQRKY